MKKLVILCCCFSLILMSCKTTKNLAYDTSNDEEPVQKNFINSDAEIPKKALVLYLDLSENEGQNLKTKINRHKNVVVKISNKVPNGSYSISYNVNTLPLDVFSIDDFFKESESDQATQQFVKSSQNFSADDSSKSLEKKIEEQLLKLRNAITNIYDQSEEKEISNAILKLKKTHQDVLKECKKIYQGIQDKDELNKLLAKYKKDVDNTIQATQQIISIGEVSYNSQLLINVKRKTITKLKTWNMEYWTDKKGVWNFSTGFSFIIPSLSNPDTYYTKQSTGGANQTPTGFSIQREHNREWTTFVPSVFVDYTPTKKINDFYVPSLTFGLGHDKENPTVFFGLSHTFNNIIKLQTGLALHRQKILLGKYKEGDQVNTDLNIDQLHTDSYRPNIFISLSVRFHKQKKSNLDPGN